MTLSTNVFWQDYTVARAERTALMRQEPLVLWLTGLSGSGKTTLANSLAQRLFDDGHFVYVLDGDNLRHGLNRDLGFDEGDRHENVRRMADVAGLMYDAGLVTLAACISPFKSERDFARSLIPAGKFVEVFVDTPLEVCEQRDSKGLYRRARAGEIRDFTGVDSPFERPTHAEVTVDTSCLSPTDCADTVMRYLAENRLLSGHPASSPDKTAQTR